MTSNQCTLVTNILCLSAIVSCACELMLLIGDVFYVVRDVQKFGFMFVAFYTHENGDQWTSIRCTDKLAVWAELYFLLGVRVFNSRMCHWNFSLI